MLVPSSASFPAPFSPPRQPPPPLTSPPRRPSLLLLSPPRPSPPLCSGRRPLSPPLAGLRHGPHPLAGTAPSSPDGRAAPSSLPRWSAPPRAPSLDGRRPAPLELPPSTTSASRSHASGGLLSPSLEVGGGAGAPDPARGGAGASRTLAPPWPRHPELPPSMVGAAQSSPHGRAAQSSPQGARPGLGGCGGELPSARVRGSAGAGASSLGGAAGAPAPPSGATGASSLGGVPELQRPRAAWQGLGGGGGELPRRRDRGSAAVGAPSLDGAAGAPLPDKRFG